MGAPCVARMLPCLASRLPLTELPVRGRASRLPPTPRRRSPQDRVALRLEAHMGSVGSMAWTKDGQILTVATSGGDLITMLGDLPTLGASSGNR